MYKRLFVIAAIALFAIARPSFAQDTRLTVDLSGLSTEQVKALGAAADELRKKPENTIANLSLKDTTPEQWQQWADAGTAAGKAVANFTKEVGIAADQFLKTDVGRIALYVIVWKVGGDKVIAAVFNAVVDGLLAIVLITIWWKMTRRFVFNERRVGKIEYNQNTILRWLGFNKKDVSWEKDDSWMDKWRSDDSKTFVVLFSRIISVALLLVIVLMTWPRLSF